MYLVRVTPLMNFTFSDDSLFLKKKILAGDINSLNLLVLKLFHQILLSSNDALRTVLSSYDAWRA